MLEFSISLSQLEKTITALNTTIGSLITSRKNVRMSCSKLIQEGWEGAAAEQFRANYQAWSAKFDSYLTDLKLLRNLLNGIKPTVEELDKQARGFSGIMGIDDDVGLTLGWNLNSILMSQHSSSAGESSMLGGMLRMNTISLDRSERQTVSSCCNALAEESYEDYTQNLQEIQTLLDQLSYTTFTLSEKENCQTLITDRQNKLRSYKAAIESYEKTVDALEVTVITEANKVTKPENYNPSRNGIDLSDKANQPLIPGQPLNEKRLSYLMNQDPDTLTDEEWKELIDYYDHLELEKDNDALNTFLESCYIVDDRYKQVVGDDYEINVYIFSPTATAFAEKYQAAVQNKLIKLDEERTENGEKPLDLSSNKYGANREIYEAVTKFSILEGLLINHPNTYVEPFKGETVEIDVTQMTKASINDLDDCNFKEMLLSAGGYAEAASEYAKDQNRGYLPGDYIVSISGTTLTKNNTIDLMDDKNYMAVFQMRSSSSVPEAPYRSHHVFDAYSKLYCEEKKDPLGEVVFWTAASTIAGLAEGGVGLIGSAAVSLTGGLVSSAGTNQEGETQILSAKEFFNAMNDVSQSGDGETYAYGVSEVISNTGTFTVTGLQQEALTYEGPGSSGTLDGNAVSNK